MSERLLSIKDVSAQVKLSEAAIRTRVRRGEFPEPKFKQHKFTRWHAAAIDEWIRGGK